MSQEVDFDQRRFRSDIILFIIVIMIITWQCHIIMIIVMLIGEEEKKVVRKLCGGTRHTCWLEPNAGNLAPSSSYDECIHDHLRPPPHTHTASPFTNVTQVVDVPMIDNRQCEQWHREKGINVIIYDEMVCAGYFHGGKVNTDQYDMMDIGDDHFK